MFPGNPAGPAADVGPDSRFFRDLAASLGAIALLGATVHFASGTSLVRNPSRLASQAEKVAVSESVKNTSQATRAARIKDERAEPAPGEERLRDAQLQFALSKVAPAWRERASQPATRTPAPVAKSAAPPRRIRKPVPVARSQAARIPAGKGQTGFVQAEWPAQTPAAQTALRKTAPKPLAGIARYLPKPRSIVNGAGSLVTGAGKMVGEGVDSLRSGVRVAGRQVATLAERLF